MITWNYVKDGMPEKAGHYLMSYAEGAVTTGYWNKAQKKWFFEGDRTEDGDPLTCTTIYAWADLPKAAAYVKDR